MKAMVKHVPLLEPKLPATHEYRAKPEPPEGWEAQKAAKRRQKVTERKEKRTRVRDDFHVWTDEERKELIRERDAGKSWSEIAESFGVSKGAVEIQARRGREKGL